MKKRLTRPAVAHRLVVLGRASHLTHGSYGPICEFPNPTPQRG